MTNKIIIDEINVAECQYFDFTESYGCYCNHNTCKDKPNCYYKQLKRKEQECEILKQSENEAGEIIAELKNDYTELENECEKLKKENSNLKSTQCHFKNETKKYKKAVHKYKIVLQDRIDRLHLSRREFLREINSVPVRIACRGEGFKNALNNFNNAIQVINNEDSYKQALDEIEEIANKQRKFDLTGKTPLTPVINEVGGDFIDILDIINKAKDGK